MSDFSRTLIRRSGYAQAGFAAGYDEHRPAPPEALLDVLTAIARTARPSLVVDLGAGTGLSTRAWAGRAAEVVGIEPNGAMLAHADAATEASNVRYVEAYAHETGLPDACADIVTCSQSFHWMDPHLALPEVARILRPEGVFAVYDYELPPVVHWEIEAVFDAFLTARRRFRAERAAPMGSDVWPKHQHLDRIRESGHFRFARDVLLHSRESGDADRVLGLARSIGGPEELQRPEFGLGRLEEVARRVLGDATATWYFGYRARVAVK